MKKVRSISQPAVPATPAPVVPATVAALQSVVPQPLSDSESLLLRYLLKLNEQANKNVTEFVGDALLTRKLQIADWAVSLADYKTILPVPKPAPQSAPAIPPTPQS
jgi:hypothetical protein